MVRPAPGSSRSTAVSAPSRLWSATGQRLVLRRANAPVANRPGGAGRLVRRGPVASETLAFPDAAVRLENRSGRCWRAEPRGVSSRADSRTTPPVRPRSGLRPEPQTASETQGPRGATVPVAASQEARTSRPLRAPVRAGRSRSRGPTSVGEPFWAMLPDLSRAGRQPAGRCGQRPGQATLGLTPRAQTATETQGPRGAPSRCRPTRRRGRLVRSGSRGEPPTLALPRPGRGHRPVCRPIWERIPWPRWAPCGGTQHSAGPTHDTTFAVRSGRRGHLGRTGADAGTVPVATSRERGRLVRRGPVASGTLALPGESRVAPGLTSPLVHSGR